MWGPPPDLYMIFMKKNFPEKLPKEKTKKKRKKEPS